MTTYRLDFVSTATGAKYSYPDGPFLPGMDVRITPKWIDFRYGPSTLAASQGVDIVNPAYGVTIFADGVQIVQKTLPVHWYYARHRHRLVPTQIVNTPKQLFDAELIPPWGALVPGKSAKDPGWTMPGPMVIAPVTQPMGTTGERPDIGTVNEGSGFWLLGGSPNSMLAFAEALNTLPLYIIDERTGRFWDKVVYPKATVYSNQIPAQTSPYWINPGPAAVQGQPGWEYSHHPEAGFIAFLATEDVYHLETLQATATMLELWTIFHYYGGQPYPTLPEGQTRGMAHALRTLALVLIATKYYEDKFGAVPAPLKPYSYWAQLAEYELTALNYLYMSEDVCQTFRAFPNVAAYAPWQQDHLLNGLALMAWKNPEWVPLYEWAFGNLYNRCLQLPGYPGPYQLRLGPNFIDGQILDPAKLTVSQYFSTWEEMIAFNLDLSVKTSGTYNLSSVQAQALIADPTNKGDWMRANFYNMFIARNALALGVWLDRIGVVNLHRQYPLLETVQAQQTAFATKIWQFDVNQFQPNRQAALAPVVTQPPPGGIHMAKPINLVPGQTVHIPLTFDDGAGGPSQPPVAITWTVTPSGMATLSNGNISGVDVKAGATMGAFTLTADDGKGHTDSAPGTVALPLCGAIHVNP